MCKWDNLQEFEVEPRGLKSIIPIYLDGFFHAQYFCLVGIQSVNTSQLAMRIIQTDQNFSPRFIVIDKGHFGQKNSFIFGQKMNYLVLVYFLVMDMDYQKTTQNLVITFLEIMLPILKIKTTMTRCLNKILKKASLDEINNSSSFLWNSKISAIISFSKFT